MATAMDSGDVLLWKHGSLGHSLQRLSAIGCHDSMVLGMDGPKGSILLTHGGDGGVTLINAGEEKVASQYQGMLLYGFGSASWFSSECGLLTQTEMLLVELPIQQAVSTTLVLRMCFVSFNYMCVE